MGTWHKYQCVKEGGRGGGGGGGAGRRMFSFVGRASFSI